MNSWSHRTVLSTAILVLISVSSLPVLFALTVEEAVVYVHPPETSRKVGEEFEIYINVRNVSGLQGFDFQLSYETGLVDCLSVDEGGFLSAFGPTFVAQKEIDEGGPGTLGCVWFAVVIYGTGFADGEGTLAIVTFNATAIGETALDLHSDLPYKADEIKLTTCGAEAIPHEVIDGHVTIADSNDPADPPDDPPLLGAAAPNPDVNGDGAVDILDLAMIAQAYGSIIGAVEYEAAVDLDQNGVVDIRDVAIAALDYGRV
jgi:hypothetical protein